MKYAIVFFDRKSGYLSTYEIDNEETFKKLIKTHVQEGWTVQKSSQLYGYCIMTKLEATA